MLSFVSATTRTPFRYFVGHVLGIRAEPEMIGANTQSIVTVMKDMQPCGDFTIGQYIGNPMRHMCLLSI